ncbi:CRISPR-associated endoribonuclease Cas6 [Thermoanaerobacter mathranii]|uniref:CRISPR-associated endoribonuclease Cas6 n=1 Tax=Thermoanaerobacter mathranii TaxID=583357 RepID=UPI003D6B7FF6
MPKLFITVKADEISRNYNMQAVAFIKGVLKNINPKKYEELYYYNDNGTVRANKRPKPFCLAVKPYFYLKPKEEMKKQIKSGGRIFEIDEESRDKIKLKDEIFTIIISSPDSSFLKQIMEEIIRNKKKYEEEQSWKFEYDPVMPDNLQEPYIRKKRIKISTITPIVVTDRDGNLIDIEKDADKFNESLSYIMNQIFLAAFNRGLKRPIKLKPLKYKIQKNILIVDGYTKTIQGYYGRFWLEGDTEDINYILSLGLGFRRSQGYGMITLAPSEKIQVQIKKNKPLKLKTKRSK